MGPPTSENLKYEYLLLKKHLEEAPEPREPWEPRELREPREPREPQTMNCNFAVGSNGWDFYGIERIGGACRRFDGLYGIGGMGVHIVQSRQSISSDVSPPANPHFQITTPSSALVGFDIMGEEVRGICDHLRRLQT